MDLKETKRCSNCSSYKKLKTREKEIDWCKNHEEEIKKDSDLHFCEKHSSNEKK